MMISDLVRRFDGPVLLRQIDRDAGRTEPSRLCSSPWLPTSARGYIFWLNSLMLGHR